MKNKINYNSEMKIIDHEYFSNETSTVKNKGNFLLNKRKKKNRVSFVGKCGGEVRIELEVIFTQKSDGSIKVDQKAKLFEGASTSSNDLDGVSSKTSIVLANQTKVIKFSVYNTAEGGDRAHFTMRVSNELLQSETPEKVTINFDINKLLVVETEDWTGPDSPFLWTFGVHIDKETIKTGQYVVKMGNPGHRNIGGDLNNNQSTFIPEDVGYYSFDVNPYKIANIINIGSISGVIVIAFDEDSIPENSTIKKGYKAAADVINEYIQNQIITKFIRNIEVGVNGINFDKLVADISSKIEKKVTAVIKGEMDKWENTKAIFSFIDKDDKIGAFSKFVSSESVEPISFTNEIKGDGAFYKISTTISIDKEQIIDKKVNYNAIRKDLNLGDIVLFSGEGVGSSIIQAFTGSRWSHVGLVYKEATKYRDVVLLESVTTEGVRLVTLGNRIKNYDGDEIAVRQLEIKRTLNMKKHLEKLYKEMKDKEYEPMTGKGAMELFKAANDKWDRQGYTLNKEDMTYIFCSELVAEAYNRMGILSSKDKLFPSNEYVPNDFSSKENLRLEKGELLEEILVG